jgi:S-adenosylmethionine hydrolase
MVSIDNPEARIPSPGETFHGRDVFAPAAALLASGEAAILDLGPEVGPEAVQPLLLPLPEIEGSFVTGEAWWVDRFGNVQTNIGPDDLAAIGVAPGATLTVKVGASLHSIPWVANYSEVDTGEPLLHVDSAGLIAIAVRDGAADDELNLSSGVAVTLARTGSTPAE